MLFQVYGANAAYQWIGWIMVFIGLILLNEFGRRSKVGGIIMFVVIPIIMTVYCIAVSAMAASGAPGFWGTNNPTVLFQNGWFHYAKVYAALTGCIGFMIIKYHWGKLGKSAAFKCFPFVIVAINIMIANVSDFESFAHYLQFMSGIIQDPNSPGSAGAFMLNGSIVWVTSEHATQIAGYNNLMNGIAGLINIMCMTGWWAVYTSKKEDDMIWADMTWVFIVAYDIWNFCYTYNCLPNHAWYCGLALLLAPTFANAIWNKGGWIQNRANTLAIWCMFAQLVPQFQDSFPSFGYDSPFAVNSVLSGTTNNVVAAIALIVNIAAIIYIIYRAKKLGVNPYKHEVFVGTKDYEKAKARIREGEIPEAA